jgi:hypothetical protein
VASFAPLSNLKLQPLAAKAVGRTPACEKAEEGT